MKDRDKSRGQLNDAAYEQIREMILKGSLAPGARIMESELAEHVGMSRTPVRSALHRLQQGGYVRALDGGKKAKLIVAPLTKEDAREIYHWTAWRPGTPHGSPTEHARLWPTV